MSAIPIESEQRERLYVKLRRELGREVLEALESPGTEDILLNPDASLWVKSTGKAAQRIGMLGASQAASAIGTLAALNGEVVNARQPVLETELPIAEARFEGLMPPLVARPSFAIRCLPRIDRTLEDYAREGIVTDRQGTLDAAVDSVVDAATAAEIPVTREALRGHPADMLIAAAADAAMLVLGTRGRGGFLGLRLGSVSTHCVHHAPCPVVVVPPPSAD